jgi:polyphosphate kinase
MDRNFFRRIEVAFPVLDKTLRQRVIDEAFVPTSKTIPTHGFSIETEPTSGRRQDAGPLVPPSSGS